MLYLVRLLCVVFAILAFVLFIVLLDTYEIVPLILMVICIFISIFCIIADDYLTSAYVDDLVGYLNSVWENFFNSNTVDTVCHCCNHGCNCCH